MISILKMIVLSESQRELESQMACRPVVNSLQMTRPFCLLFIMSL